MTMTKVNT